jgi:hypothetical protein
MSIETAPAGAAGRQAKAASQTEKAFKEKRAIGSILLMSRSAFDEGPKTLPPNETDHPPDFHVEPNSRPYPMFLDVSSRHGRQITFFPTILPHIARTTRSIGTSKKTSMAHLFKSRSCVGLPSVRSDRLG